MIVIAGNNSPEISFSFVWCGDTGMYRRVGKRWGPIKKEAKNVLNVRHVQVIITDSPNTTQDIMDSSK